MANEVKIDGNLNASISEMQQEFPKYFKAALMAGASVLKMNTKESFKNVLPAATRPNPRYNDTLVDAVANGKLYEDEVTVHVMGRNEPGSGAYRARFFEVGTKDRYQKKRNGKKLKKNKYLGKIRPLRFFANTVSSSEQQVMAEMEAVIDNLFKKYN